MSEENSEVSANSSNLIKINSNKEKESSFNESNESGTDSAITDKICSIHVTRAPKTPDRKSLLFHNDNNNVEFDIDTKGEFDDYIFSADIATPALEEPEMSNICGSSSSLIMKVDSFRRSSKNKKNTACHSATHSDDELTLTSVQNLNDYRRIQSMFAKQVTKNDVINK